MAVEFTNQQIQDTYRRIARWYDPIEGCIEALGLGALRGRLLMRAEGKILDVGAGTGKSLPRYEGAACVTLADLSEDMLAIARGKCRRSGSSHQLVLADTENLAFADGSFDTVVSTLTLCTYGDPVKALKEMARVCRPDGRMLLLEHGRSSQETLGRFQDRHADRHARALACRWNREPQELVVQAGLRLVSATRYFFGIFHLLEARIRA